MTSDRDNLIRHSVVVLVLTHIASVGNLLFHVVMGRTLSKEEYGILVSMLGIALIFTTPMVAMQNTLAHFAARLAQENRAGDIRGLIHKWMKKIFMVGAPLCLLILVLSSPLASALHLASSLPLVLTTLTILAALFVPVLSGALQGTQSFVWMSVTANAWGIVRLIAGAALVVCISATAVSGLTAYAAGMVASLAIGFVAVALVVPRGGSTGQEAEQSDRYFLLSLASVLGYSVLMYADMILVKRFFTDPEDYGNYARAATIARTMVFLPQPIAGALFPKVVSDGSRSEADTGRLVKALLFGCVIIAGSLTLCIMFPELLLLALYKDTAPTAAMLKLVRTISCAMAPLGLTFLLMNFELAQRRFACLWILFACAAALVGGICLFHSSLWNVVTVLACCATMSTVALATVSFRKRIRC
jgi:O-antigen/teichoic acid export membrane protein